MTDDSARNRILGRIRQALTALPERAAYPEYADTVMATARLAPDPWTEFSQRLRAVNGKALDSLEELRRLLVAQGWTHGYCDPELRAAVGEPLAAELTVEYTFEPERLDDYRFGITRAVGAIAETGSIVINDASTADRLAALAPWVHVAVLRPRDLWPDVATAVANLGTDPNTIWITGPSKTADVEGILIEGVHGPGEEICLRLDW